jgi:L-ascorbate metabolism protein UlaG (beta-lactamase superfamily)
VTRLTWIGHATVVIDIGGVRLLTDPLLRRHAGPLRRIGPRPDPEAWRDADAVLVSHLHSDHASLASLRSLAGVPMLSGRANARWLQVRAGATVPELAEDQWVTVPGSREVEVRLVRADHHSRPMPHRPNGAHGHLVRASGSTVWFAGDTSVYPEMAELPRVAETPIDIALLPIAGWGPRLSAGHMGPREAVDAVELVRPRAVLPIHHGTLHPPGFELGGLDWMHRPLREFEQELADRCPEITLLRAGLGESVDLP